MVPYSDILNSNSSLRHCGSGLTAAFLGATNGIGLATLLSLTKNTDSPTIFIVGRSRSKLDDVIFRLKTLNGKGTYHPVLSGDLSLTREASVAAKKVCEETAKLDLVVMSPGWLSFAADYVSV